MDSEYASMSANFTTVQECSKATAMGSLLFSVPIEAGHGSSLDRFKEETSHCLLSSFPSGWVLLPVSMEPQLELPLFRHFLRSPAVPDFWGTVERSGLWMAENNTFHRFPSTESRRCTDWSWLTVRKNRIKRSQIPRRSWIYMNLESMRALKCWLLGISVTFDLNRLLCSVFWIIRHWNTVVGTVIHDIPWSSQSRLSDIQKPHNSPGISWPCNIWLVWMWPGVPASSNDSSPVFRVTEWPSICTAEISALETSASIPSGCPTYCLSLFPVYCFQSFDALDDLITVQAKHCKIGQPLAVGALYTARSLRLVGYTFGSCSADANEPQTAAKSVSNVIRSKHVQTQSASGFMESPVIVQILIVFRCDVSNVFQVEKSAEATVGWCSVG